MKNILIFLVLCLVATQIYAEDEGPSDVVVLTEANFDEKIKDGNWLLEFYAPWCGHCKKLAPTYDKVATELKGKVNVGKVDCTVEKELCPRFGIRGFPTLKFVSNGQIYDYKGDRSQENLVTYSTGGFSSGTASPLPAAAAPQAQQQQQQKQEQQPQATGTESSDVVVLTDSNFDELTSKGDWLLEFYAPWCGHCKKLAPVYEKVATSLKGKTHVGKVDCTEQTGVCRRFGIRGYPTVKFLRQGLLRDYKGDRSENDLVTYTQTGWQSVEGTALPGKPNAVDEVLAETSVAIREIEKLVKDKLWLSLGGVFLFGLILGMILCSSSPEPARPQPRPATTTSSSGVTTGTTTSTVPAPKSATAKPPKAD